MNDPYATECEIIKLKDDRLNWLKGHYLKQETLEGFKKKMKTKYTYLFGVSELLFNKIVEGDMDAPENFKRLQKMIALSKQIYDGKKKQSEVDKQLGKELADEYVQPIIDKLNKDSSEKEGK